MYCAHITLRVPPPPHPPMLPECVVFAMPQACFLFFSLYCYLHKIKKIKKYLRKIDFFYFFIKKNVLWDVLILDVKRLLVISPEKDFLGRSPSFAFLFTYIISFQKSV